ncbi:MAG TPA: M14 metallopeptidase family protein [Vicinamibacterales bacterium]|nr:M14 metallopeptidase family protein [Vicinamibacterales bacterium]
MINIRRSVVCVLALLLVCAASPRTQSPIAAVTSPKAQFGFDIGDDYVLANYTQIEAYWKKLDAESDRMSLVDIGRSEEGRTQWMAIVSAPENIRALDRYKDISRRLARAETLGDDQARALAAAGKAIVWIDGGLHATEVLGTQQLIETAYELVSRNDPETLRVLRDDIILLVNCNPDGEELTANWYMREPEPAKRTLAGLPRLYQKYTGHDDNRDFYMSTQAETINMNRVLYKEWFPQIVYDHHQSGPAGTVMFAPPFRDPFNYVFDPLIPLGIDQLGAAMHGRFAAEGKAGVTMRRGSTYSTWWNGGLRTTAYFHNQIGLLTEAIGNPTPVDIPFVAERQVPSADLPFPIAPQRWRFRQAIDYELTANRAVLDAASRYRETLLFNMYRMGKNSIERGGRDTWTLTPHHRTREPQSRDARGYILSADQPDFLTATKFVNTLLLNGVTVMRATAPFAVNGTHYPAGSFVVKTNQAFRPHVLDMFEPQDHPDDIPYPGAPPTPPYDNAGWTLAFQMGVKFDRILDGFDGPFETIAGPVRPPAGRVVSSATASGFVVSHQQNDAFVAVNRLLNAGAEVSSLRDTFYVSGAGAVPVLQKAAADLGLTFTAVSQPPLGGRRLRPMRVGLWDRYGGSVESGWIRWLLERYEFPFEVVYPPALDEGDLKAKFDVLIFPTGAIPARDAEAPAPPANVPDEYRGRIGAVTVARTVPALKAFVDAGGTLIAIGSSTTVARHFGLPVSGAIDLPRSKFYVPGSILRASVDTTSPLAFGLEPQADVFFDDSPAFALGPEATGAGVRRVAWYDTETPLRSGWAWGQASLKGSAAVVDAPLGSGRVLLFGPEITFRAQSHGTFKFLFNGIYYGSAAPASSQALALSRSD